MMVVVEPVIHGASINPEGEGTTVNQRLVILRPVGDGVKRRAHDAGFDPIDPDTFSRLGL